MDLVGNFREIMENQKFELRPTNFLKLLRRRRILRRVQRTKKPEVLFNRVVKRIHEFVLGHFLRLLESVEPFWRSKTGSRRPPDRAKISPSVSHLFCRPLLEQVDAAEPASTRKNRRKRGFWSEFLPQTGSISCEARNLLMWQM